MKVYQAHYSYSPLADDGYYYSGSEGNIYSTKEACIAEAEDWMNPEDGEFIGDTPISYTINEIVVLDSYKK